MGQKAPLPKSVSLRSHAGALRQSALNRFRAVRDILGVIIQRTQKDGI